MDLATLTSLLGWCSLINIGILLYWFMMFTQAHDWVYQLHSKWFQISVEQFDVIHYKAMAGFKLSIFVLNIAPWLALQIMGGV